MCRFITKKINILFFNNFLKKCLIGIAVLTAIEQTISAQGLIMLDKEIDNYPAIVTATQQIILKPGFHIKAAHEDDDAGTSEVSLDAKIGTTNYSNVPLALSSNFMFDTPTNPTSWRNYINTTTYLSSTDSTKTLSTIQYFDGLGRPIETVQTGSTTLNGADIITMIEYDGFGREWKRYIPTAVNWNNGRFVYSTASSNSDSRPYTETLLEPSPLSRVLGQRGVGVDWENHPSVMDYQTNDGSIFCFYVNSSNQLVKGANYDSNTLYKTVTTDEDGKAVFEYKDKQGQVVMKQSSNDVQTYYVYNDLDQLCYVLLPNFIDGMGNTTSFDDSNVLLKQFGYIYRYDGRGNCIYKRLPGCEPIYMVYDRADRLVLSQDGNQRIIKNGKNQWTITKYDALGRLIETGTISSIAISKTLDNLVTDYKDQLTTETYTDNSGYSNQYFTDFIPLVIKYYDSYNFINLLTEQYGKSLLLYDNSQEQYGFTPQWNSANGQLTGIRTYILDGAGTNYLTESIYYDDKGQVAQVRSTNQLGGYNISYSQYNFTGQLLRTLKKHKIANNSEVTELYQHTYDSSLRLLTTTYTLNNQTAVLLASNTYDGLGRLINKTRHNETESGQYDYNIRNWPTKIKNGGFEENLYYNKDLPTGTKACYNGNIAYSTWTYNGATKGYSYDYDDLNRLESASFKQGTSTQANGSFDESFTFDKMGNVLTLKRKWNNTLVDDLTLHYANNEKNNQIDWITDAQGTQALNNTKEYQDISKATSGEFKYDANGNITKDLDRNIGTIQYNLLNLPDVIQFKNGNQIKNLYDASGKKLQANYYTRLSTLPIPLADDVVATDVSATNLYLLIGTNYVGNFEYAFSNDDGDYQHDLDKIYNNEGYVQNPSNPQYFYFRRDQLGDNREVWLANTNEVVQRTQYYPSGLPWASNSGDNPAWQNKKYNGKEFIEMNGYDTYDYGARQYYPAIGRFTSVDPLAEKHYNISPYVYCGDNPVNRTDPDGRDWVDHKGKIIWINNVTSANDKDLQKGDKYLGRNVLVGTHNRDANLKEPINGARFDLYLESNHKGASAKIYGNTVPADTKKSGTLAEGLYKAVSGHRNKPQYQNELALRIYNINGTDGLPTVNGNPNPRSDGKTLTGVLFHIGNQYQESLKDSKGHPYSEGCQTSHNGSDAEELHNAFFENIGNNFDGYYYLRGQ